MPRNLTFRCSKETAKRIETALAVRGSGLFPIHPRDSETSEEAALLDAITGQWMADLKEKHVTTPQEPRAFATGYGAGRVVPPTDPPQWPKESAHGRGDAQSLADDVRDVEADAGLRRKLDEEAKAKRDSDAVAARTVRRTSDDGK